MLQNRYILLINCIIHMNQIGTDAAIRIHNLIFKQNIWIVLDLKMISDCFKISIGFYPYMLLNAMLSNT